MDGSRRLLDPVAAAELLARFGIEMPVQAVSASVAGTALAAERIGFPVVLKAVGASQLHKSDGGGVRLGLADPGAVLAAAQEMGSRIGNLDGFLVQAMVRPGTELVVGVKRDALFGPVVVAGLGGIWVEALEDVAVRLAPVTLAAAVDMLMSLRGARVLTGFRGAPPVDLDRVAELIVALGRLATLSPMVAEVDLNPVIAGADGVLAVDARVVVEDAVGATPSRRPPRDEDVAALMAPRSVVVVGASADAAKQGQRVLRYLLEHGFEGAAYPVNRSGAEVLGRKAYRSVADLPAVPDLACIAVPAVAVKAVVEECVAAGIRAAVVFSSGFAEVGPAGEELQADLARTARRGGLAICGPNTGGLMNAAARFCAASLMSFESASPHGGEIAMVAQSGAVASSLLGRAWADGTGFSHWICTGNEADLTVADYIRYLAWQPDARVIVLFLESVRDAEGFLEACRLARRAGKPLVVYKTGASPAGAHAVASHTGALAGDDRVYDAAIRAGGGVRVRELQQLLDVSLALAWQPLPAGPRLGIVSTSGGLCSVVADEAYRNGLQVLPLAASSAARITAIIPVFATAENPVDVTMDFAAAPAMVGDTLEVLLAENTVDIGLVVLTTNADPLASAVARRVIEVAAGTSKPVLVTRLGPEHLAPAALALYRAARIPVYPMPERTVRVARAMLDYTRAGG